MKIVLKKVSQAGNNCLADLYFDEVKVNVAGHLMMSVSEFETFSQMLICAQNEGFPEVEVTVSEA